MVLAISPTRKPSLLHFPEVELRDLRQYLRRWLADHRPGPQSTNAGLTPRWVTELIRLADAMLAAMEGR